MIAVVVEGMRGVDRSTVGSNERFLTAHIRIAGMMRGVRMRIMARLSVTKADCRSGLIPRRVREDWLGGTWEGWGVVSIILLEVVVVAVVWNTAVVGRVLVGDRGDTRGPKI